MIRLRDRKMTPGKWLKVVATVLLAFLGETALIYPSYHAYRLVHQPHLLADLTPQMTGLPVERVTFPAIDGMMLVGWFVPNPSSTATIIFSHGSAANGPSLWPYARFLQAGGYNVLLFDHRGHGQSPGDLITFGVHEVRDFLGAVEYTQTRPGLDSDRIGALGLSMGAGVVLVAASQTEAVRAAVADSLFTDLGQVIKRMGLVTVRGLDISFGRPLLWWASLWTGENLAAFRPIDAISHISPRAVLLIQGREDNGACTVEAARALYTAAAPPKELWLVPEAGHCGAYFTAPEEYERRVLDFFHEYLKVRG